MSVAFADTYYYLALLSKSDVAHAAAVAFSKSKRLRTVTTDWVLTEVGDALSGVADRGKFRPFIEVLRKSAYVTIVPFSAELFERGIVYHGARTDKAWSLTDCIAFVVMQDRGLRDTLTADHHFEQAGFRRLL